MEIAYTGRTPKADAPYRWHSDTQALAAHVDFLVVCASGGAQTKGLIDAAVLQALGPHGVLVNIGRGSIVDEDALLRAAGGDLGQIDAEFARELAHRRARVQAGGDLQRRGRRAGGDDRCWSRNWRSG